MYLLTIENINKNKIFKIAVSIFLILIILTMSFITQYNQAHAIDWVEEIRQRGDAVLALLVTAGMSFTAMSTLNDLNNAADWFMNEAAPAVKESVTNLYNSAVNGVTTVTDELWNYAKNWVDSKINTGTNLLSSLNLSNYVYENEYNPVHAAIPPFASSAYDNLNCSESITFNGKSYTVVRVAWNYTEVYCDDIKIWSINRGSNNIKGLYITKNGTESISICMARYDYGWGTEVLSTVPITGITQGTLNLKENKSISVNGDSSVDNPTRDFKTVEGVRKIAIPQTTEQLIGITSTDLQNQTMPLAYPTTWTGKFTDASSAVASKQWIYPEYINSSITGTWQGTWELLSTGEKKFTGTIENLNVTISQNLNNTQPSPTPSPPPINKPMIPVMSLPETWIGDFEDYDPAEKANPSPNRIPYTFTPPEVGTQTGTWTGQWTESADGIRTFTGELVKPDGQTIPQVQVTGGPVNDNPDLTDATKNWDLPDLFLLILKVILATMRMIADAIIFVATLALLPADGSKIPAEARTTLNTFKNVTIPNTNFNFWTLFTAFLTFLYSLYLFKIVKRWVMK